MRGWAPCALRTRNSPGQGREGPCRHRRFRRGERAGGPRQRASSRPSARASRAFVRKDPTERAVPQVLAANFDRVILAQPLAEVNLRRLERELVLAYETGAAVTVVLTKADLAESEEQVEQVADRVPRWRAPTCARWWCRTATRKAWRPCAPSWPPVPPRCWWGSRAWGSPAWSQHARWRRGAGNGHGARGRRQGPPHHGQPRDGGHPPAAGTWWTCPACAAWGCGTPTRASARRSLTSSRRRSSAVSATASMRTNRVAPCAPPSNPAR